MNSSLLRFGFACALVLLQVPGPGTAVPSPGPCTGRAAIFSRVPGQNPPESAFDPGDPAAWKVVRLEGRGARGPFRAAIARPPRWIDIVGVAPGAEVRVDLGALPAAGPVRVLALEPPPVPEAAPGILVTGIIEEVVEDAAGADTLCHLEAHEFGGTPLEPDSVWTLIKQFRRRGRISRSKGTVAFIELSGQRFFGVNSSLDDDLAFVDEQREGDHRRRWHERLEPTYPYGRARARYLIHAEGHALMKAYRQLGFLPRETTLFVDRETCWRCRDRLGKLMEAMGIDRLSIRQKNIDSPLVLEAGGPVEEAAPPR